MKIWTPRHPGKMTWVQQGRLPPVLFPRTERDYLRNELWELKYFVAGAEKEELVPLEQLKDIVQMAREQKVKQDVADTAAGEDIFDTMDPEQRRQAMVEFITWRNKRRNA